MSYANLGRIWSFYKTFATLIIHMTGIEAKDLLSLVTVSMIVLAYTLAIFLATLYFRQKSLSCRCDCSKVLEKIQNYLTDDVLSLKGQSMCQDITLTDKESLESGDLKKEDQQVSLVLASITEGTGTEDLPGAPGTMPISSDVTKVFEKKAFEDLAAKRLPEMTFSRDNTLKVKIGQYVSDNGRLWRVAERKLTHVDYLIPDSKFGQKEPEEDSSIRPEVFASTTSTTEQYPDSLAEASRPESQVDKTAKLIRNVIGIVLFLPFFAYFALQIKDWVVNLARSKVWW